MSRVETTWMRSGALVLIATAWLAGPAVAAERSETLTLDASALEVENLVGSVQLRAAAGRDFVVEATIVAERIRERVFEIVSTPSGEPVTISVGVAERRGSESMPDVTQRADDALYRAKSAGRNRVEGT